MEIRRTEIEGLLELRPTPHRDHRGFFSRTFDTATAAEAGIDGRAFLQDSLSRSAYGVVRGLHVRVGRGENKLVRCSSGAVFDVVVDLRPGSPTHGRHVTFRLDGDEQNSIYVPAGCAHGFQALTDPADTSYRIDAEHDPTEDLTIAWDDPDLAIEWPLPASAMSEADRHASPLAECAEGLARIAPGPR
ncbi:dTDP-4-dehydrorhamnose 3,5-epimerase [uncultured Nocardioides sp.]|uniref:dTDP-4-dehydrorhamnose 3,5-epimerase n=1 Tax=uncultured Nocardioides sp. TaxID=198441 RepID=UPI00262008CE|nr:dTDP-4-dehydrorhamnose 3,5-epimerase [uncultured Nocardioides sp.]